MNNEMIVCEHPNGRFLDCDECGECHVVVCVDCGAEYEEGDN